MGITAKLKKIVNYIKSNNGKIQLTVSQVNGGGICEGEKL